MIQFKHTLRRNHYHYCHHDKVSTFHQEDKSSFLRWFTHPYSLYRDLLWTLLLLHEGGWM